MLGRVFENLDRAFEKLGHVFLNKYSAKCFVKESLWKSGQ